MDEKSLLERANEERERLFQRYERGREPGAEIDPWEDPGFEVYHQTDRYGFIHDKRLPQKIDPNEAKLRSIEMERVKKWLKMLKNWNSKDTQEKLHKRIYKGIPDKLRSQVWMKLLNIDKIMSEKKNVYQNMLKLARQWSTEARQIDSDVNRQFREHLFYRERYSIKQRSLFNVLTAYSMYNMEVGYCQGMSGVAGVLLMYMDEEEAFWALSTLLADKKYAMHGLYIEGFPKLNRLVQHHDKIIEKFLPKLKKHFDLHNLDSMIYSLKWFFVIFIERIPFSLCLRVWDIYLLDGERVVTAMAYTILKLHHKKLLKLKDMDLLVQYLQTKLHKDFGYDDDHVIKIFEQSLDELRKSKMDLAPMPQQIEFPKRPFGVFIEPTVETKIGRRKSDFTDTEKEVTENVILRREKTQQEIAESTISDGGLEEGSNSQLNTEENWEFMHNYNKAMPSRLHARDKRLWSVLNHDEQYSSLPTRLLHGNIPESEDGGSFLGSSRKSLADTSITSTADLSVFSTGQRSQQFDICVDDTRSTHSDADGEEEGGESSPGSAFGSLSIVGRTPSAMMITPTPRAISPHDIVRIYVPPAPPNEESCKSRASSNQSTTSSPASNKLTGSPTIKSSSSTHSGNRHQQHHYSSHPQQQQQHHYTKMMITTNSSKEDITRTTTSSPPSNYYHSNNFHEINNYSRNSSKRNSVISGGDITPVRKSFIYQSDENLVFTENGEYNISRSSCSGGGGGGSGQIDSISSLGGVGDEQIHQIYYQSSSSRRGSLTRKSPSITNLIECEHLRNKRRSMTDTSDEQSTITQGISSENDDTTTITVVTRKTKVMTSFEELARLSKRENKQQSSGNDQRKQIKLPHNERDISAISTTSDDDDYSYSSKIKSKYDPINKCNIQYKALATSPSLTDIEFIQRQSSDEGIMTTATTTSATNEDTREMMIYRKRSSNSDDNSLSSPNQSKSLLTTPVNEHIESPLSAIIPQPPPLQSLTPLSSSGIALPSYSNKSPNKSKSLPISPSSPSLSSSSSSSSGPLKSSPSSFAFEMPLSLSSKSHNALTSSQSTQKLINNFAGNSGDTTPTTATHTTTMKTMPIMMTETEQYTTTTIIHDDRSNNKSTTNRRQKSLIFDDDDDDITQQQSPSRRAKMNYSENYDGHNKIGNDNYISSNNSSSSSSKENRDYGRRKIKLSDIHHKGIEIETDVENYYHNRPSSSSPVIISSNKMIYQHSPPKDKTPQKQQQQQQRQQITGNNQFNNINLSSSDINNSGSSRNSNNKLKMNIIDINSGTKEDNIISHSHIRHLDNLKSRTNETFNVVDEYHQTIEHEFDIDEESTDITPIGSGVRVVDYDRRIAVPLGGPYDYHHRNHFQHIPNHSHANKSKDLTNKIRIKVQQNQ